MTPEKHKQACDVSLKINSLNDIIEILQFFGDGRHHYDITIHDPSSPTRKTSITARSIETRDMCEAFRGSLLDLWTKERDKLQKEFDEL